MLPFVSDDMARVVALHELSLLDTPPQPRFDRVTEHCAELFECPISLLSLIDLDRQWALSSFGIDLKEIARHQSFCHHVVANGDHLMVSNAEEDSRFSANPYVAGKPGIRSYLGKVVRGPSGHPLGALCIADSKPRSFDDQDIAKLERLAMVVEDLIDAHNESRIAKRLNDLLVQETSALAKSAQLLKQAERIGGMGAWEYCLDSQSLRFSDQMYALSALKPGDPIDPKRALDAYHPADRRRVDKAIKDAAIEGRPLEYEAEFVAEDGTTKRIRCVGERLEGSEADTPRVVGVVRDITEFYHANLALERAANFDSLTGIHNRHAFDRSLHERIREYRRSQQSVSLILLDLDGFKDINDTFGHVVGDLVLEELTSRVQKVLDDATIFARWGGDEFALLPPSGTSLMEAYSIAEAALEAIGQQIEISGRKLQVSGTAGIALLEEGLAAKELIRRADIALYEGKKRERAAIHVYNVAFEKTNNARRKSLAKVREALDHERVFPAYQPIVDLSDRRPVGFESLMRLVTRDGVRMSATEVLPAIIDPILSREITEHMLGHVCCDLTTLQQAHPDMSFVSVNVAEADLLSRGFAEKLLLSLSESSVPNSKLTLEITETMLLVNDNGTVRQVLQQLHEAGVAIALDDFGTGYSSLSHLRDFPIDKVKIDKSFVQSMAGDWQARTIVQALIAMARNMKIDVIAEGIETEDQRELLLQMGCTLGQGYLFSPALDIGSLALGTLNQSRAYC